ncbi:disulfide bond formation protein B [Sphingomonas sp.]|uniref:disulfide bond formation protein B n=1 Tax=Sphingomonas sp. TaxID=28214 RepID=UPI0025CFCA44|nr:disulfide bond formation protein B [Sphingomonas sp.]
MTRLERANAVALALPAALLAGAWGSQLIGHLYPCEMCHWQRWPHYAAVVIALLAFAVTPLRRPLVALAAVAIIVSGVIGVFHAGVEYHWWDGFTTCSRIGGATLADIMRAPVIRCDVAQWTLFGISLAGFNAAISLAGGFYILNLLRTPPR